MRIVQILALGLLLNACSSLFYYPSKLTHFPPEMVDAKPQDVWIAMPSKGQLHAWYFPQISEKKSKAVLVYFHGNSGNVTSHFLNLYWLTRQGFDVLLFDYRGFGFSTFSKAPAEITRLSTIEDGVAALEWAAKQDGARPLIVYGQSLGGAVAPQSLVRFKDRARVKLLFLESTFHSYRGAMSRVMSTSWLTWAFQWVPYLSLSEDYSSKHVLSEIAPIPTVVMHGNRDRTVAYGLGRKVYERLSNPKEFWHIEGGQHSDAFWAHNGTVRRRFLVKMHEVLGLPFAPPPYKGVDFGFSYSLPFERGAVFKVLQGRGGSFSHKGVHEYAVDFEMPKGSPVCAARAGVVKELQDGFGDGAPQDRFLKQANYVIVEHEDGAFAEYFHLEKGSLQVKVGDKLEQGQCFARSGKSGFAARPHLHFMVFSRLPNGEKRSLPFVIDSKEGAALVPTKGKNYTRL
jgi:murein DD-endopeptidase MepM/ murein hydrolase activator NlpD